MRKKVRKSLAFLLALALVVSVMSGLGLSVSADEAQPQTEPAQTEEVQDEAVKETPKAEKSTPEEGEEEEEADPDAEAVPEEKKDVKKAEGEGSGEKAAENKAAETPKAGENVQTATIGTGDKTVTVKTTAAAGVLPEGAKLVVKKLADQEQAYQDAESTLRDSQVTYDDFLALDVSFEVNGKEVEPEAGSVQVQFELGAGLLPETADTSTLAVQHLTDGKAEMIADASAVTAGDVTVKNEVVKADFEVQSFSTFTITWSSGWSTYFRVTVHYVNEDGDEIDASHSGMSIDNGETIEFAEQASEINGYAYQSAHYGTRNGAAVTKVVASSDDGFFPTRYLTFYNGDSRVGQLSRGRQEETKTADVYLVYKADETGGGGSGGTITEEQSLNRRKYVEDNGNGTYDLSLTVSGAKGTQANPAKLDIVLVLDKSGSMDDPISETDRTKRLKAIQDAAGKFIDAVGSNQSIDAKYKVITFSGPNSIPKQQPSLSDSANCITSGWVNGNAAKKGISGITASGGTNYEAGIEVAKTEMNNSTRDGAQTAVIFFSDGVPTFRQTHRNGGGSAGYGYPDNGWGNGQTDPSGYNLDAAKAAAANLTCNYFYCIGTGGAVPTSLSALASSANSVKYGSYTTNSAADLAKIFEDIAADITTFLCSNVTVTDVLSENVQMVMGSDNKPKKLVVTVKDKSGNTVATPVGITASYDADQKKIVMDFPDKYELNPEYTYIVTATIEATEKAYERYRANGNAYPDTGEADTGVTSAGQKGVFSNEDGEAKVTYEYNKKPGEAEYPMPVIQLHPGTLIVKKSITGDLTEAEKTALVNKMAVDVTVKEKENKVPLSEFTPGNDGTYTLTFKGLSPNTAYSVRESDADVEGYDLTTNPSTLPVSGSVAGDTTATVSIINNYTPSNRTITLKKVVKGNMGDTNKEFKFSVSGGNATITKDTLKDDEETTITAKVGEKVTISEVDYTSDGYTTTAEGVTGGTYNENTHSYTFTVTKDMSESTIITFTNDKTIQPPNGIITTIAPYAIMVVLAAGAGVYFVYSRRRRNG